MHRLRVPFLVTLKAGTSGARVADKSRFSKTGAVGLTANSARIASDSPAPTPGDLRIVLRALAFSLFGTWEGDGSQGQTSTFQAGGTW